MKVFCLTFSSSQSTHQVGIQLRDLRLGPEVHHEPGVDHHHEGQPAAQRAQPTFLQRPGAGRDLPLRRAGYGSLTHLHGGGDTIVLLS